MTIKELLIQEIQSSSDSLLEETLDFLRFLKAKETQKNSESEVEVVESTSHTPVQSTGKSPLEHLKTIGKWQGDDLEECLQLVYAISGKINF